MSYFQRTIRIKRISGNAKLCMLFRPNCQSVNKRDFGLIREFFDASSVIKITSGSKRIKRAGEALKTNSRQLKQRLKIIRYVLLMFLKSRLIDAVKLMSFGTVFQRFNPVYMCVRVVWGIQERNDTMLTTRLTFY